MFKLKKRYPSHVLSLIQELNSSVTANEILSRYEPYKDDPLLVPLYSIYFQVKSQSFYSSLALSLIKAGDFEVNLEKINENLVLLPGISEIMNESANRSECNKVKFIKRDQKSLKKLSFEVKNIVAEKKNCTYKEVADTMAQKESQENERNIRRRVYDAINVLTAIGVLKKKGKFISFVGKNEEMVKKVEKKRGMLKMAVRKYENYLGIITRNQANPTYRNSIPFPFLIILQSKNVTFTKASIKTEVSPASTKLSSNKKIKFLSAYQILHHLKILPQPLPCLSPEVYTLLNPS